MALVLPVFVAQRNPADGNLKLPVIGVRRRNAGKFLCVFSGGLLSSSEHMAEQDAERFWRRRARVASIRYNFAAWLAVFLPIVFVQGAVASCAILFVRKADAPLQPVWIGCAGALAAAAIVAIALSRRKFFSVADALVRLDAVLHLHNRLTAAAAKIGEWPAPADTAHDGFRWNWLAIFTPLAGSALLVAAAASVPLGSKTFAPPHPAEQPVAWTQIESWLDKLEAKRLVEEQALEKLREQIEELKKQSAENWFTHSSLEAGDNLRQQMEQSLRELKRDLEKASAALAAAEQLGVQASPEDLKAVSDALQEALKGMELGNLPLDKDTLAKLKDLNPANLKQITPEQLKHLLEQMKDGAKICKLCLNPQADGEGIESGLAMGQDGNGGVNRGPGSPPLTLKENPSDLGTTRTEKIAADELSHAAPGEALGVSKGKHEIDPKKYTGPTQAGAVASPGRGGEAVWRNTLTPQEREVLQRFFK
jgi:hypothetical protein